MFSIEVSRYYVNAAGESVWCAARLPEHCEAEYVMIRPSGSAYMVLEDGFPWKVARDLALVAECVCPDDIWIHADYLKGEPNPSIETQMPECLADYVHYRRVLP